MGPWDVMLGVGRMVRGVERWAKWSKSAPFRPTFFTTWKSCDFDYLGPNHAPFISLKKSAHFAPLFDRERDSHGPKSLKIVVLVLVGTL